MTNKLQTPCKCATWHIQPKTQTPTGFPNWLKNSNGLDLADSLRQHEDNFINSFQQ